MSLRCRLLTLVLILASTVLANTPKEAGHSPGVRVFSSSDGRWSVRVSAAATNWQQHKPWAKLIGWNPDGSERVVWERQLLNHPQRILVYDGRPDGRDKAQSTWIVTIGEWRQPDGEQALVVYNPGGRVVRILTLRSVLG